jgi:hypothetical protein
LGASTYWTVVTKKTASLAEAQQELALSRPAFLSSASAAATTLDEEAGISIYVNAGKTLNLGAAYNAMGSVEYNTSNYVIGTLDNRMRTGLTSDDYPHCFVDVNGWIIVYYLKVDLANPSTTGWLGKIIDWNLYTNNQLSGTLLSEGLNYIGGQLNVLTTNAQYYHFQYASATKLLLAIKHAPNVATETFNIEIPSSFTIHEQSWSCYSSGAAYTFKIDSNTIGTGSGRNYGGPQITTTILSPDVFHVVTIIAGYNYWGADAYVCLLLLYS